MSHFNRCLRKAVLFCGSFSFISYLLFPIPLVAASSGDVPQSQAWHSQEAPVAAQSLAFAALNAEPQPLSSYARVENLAEAYAVMGPQAPDAPIATSTTINEDDPDPTVVGETYVVTFTVVRTEANPEGYSVKGTVDVSDGTGDTCSYSWTGDTPSYPNGWIYFCHLTSYTAGPKELVATFTPYDPTQFSGSVSVPVPHQVNQADTITTITHSPASPKVCDDITLTAAIFSVPPGGGSPSSGTVTFYDGAASIGTGTYAGSSQWSMVTTLPPGWHYVHAVYGGDSNYYGSTSLSDLIVVGKANSITSIGSTPSSPQTYGTAITLSATASGTCGTPTGIVYFNDGGSLIGSTSLNASGVATLVVPVFSVGTHALSASYPGDTIYNSSTSTTLNLVVNKANSATTLSASPATAAEGETVVLTADVDAVSPGIGTPGGMVIFKDSGTPLASVALDGAGKAVWLASSLPSGAHSITAEYSGDVSFEGCSSTPIVVTIQSQADVSIEKASGPGAVYTGEQMEYQVTVNNHGPSEVQEVTVFDVFPDEVTYQIDSSGSCTQPVELVGLRATLDGASEVPPASTPASGLATFVLDTATNQLSFAIHVSQIGTITAAHIHAGIAGVNGPVYVPLYSGAPLFDPTHPFVGEVTLTPAQVSAILADPPGYYVNVHTSAFPGGEIRGQLVQSLNTPLKCELDTIQANQTRNFIIYAATSPEAAPGSSITNVAMVSSVTDLGDPVIWNNVSRADNLLQGKADLKVTKYGKPDHEVRAGELLTYTIFVDNLGPGLAHTVVLTDVLESSGSFNLLSVDTDRPAICTPSSGTFTGLMQIRCDLTDPLEVMSPTVSGRWKLVIVVTAEESQSINNTVLVVGADLDPNFSNNQAIVEHDITDVADLSITKTAAGEVQVDGQPGGTVIQTPDQVTAGQILTYTLDVTNAGPSTAENLVAQDRLPAWVEVQSITPSQGTCNWGTPGDPWDKMTCGLGALAPSTNATITIRMQIPSWMSNESILRNDALVYSDVFDPNNADNFAFNQVTVDAWADISVSKLQWPDIVLPDGVITYTITVSNTGPSDAPGVLVVDLVPPELTDVTWSCTASTHAVCTASGAGDIDDTVILPAGETITYTLEGTVNTYFPLTNTVDVSTSLDAPDPYLLNNQSSTTNEPYILFYSVYANTAQ